MIRQNQYHQSGSDRLGRGQHKNNPVILVAENAPEVRQVLEKGLQNSCQFLSAASGSEALKRFDEASPDLVLLDVELPGIPSWEVCRQVLGKTRVPIVFLSTSHREDDAIRALRLGAVDYVTTTTAPQILLARTRAALRRKEAFLPEAMPQVYDDGYLQINLAAQEVCVGGEVVPLTTIEYNLLVYLLKKANQVCSAEQILSQIWGAGYETSLNYVHLYVGRLRRKLEHASNRPKYLVNVYGKGYYFRLDSAPSM
ncbi:MAG: response regulator transcription factor [Caldilineaceae bacterium]|nr:response regulator transcription factor [Caldilineaceae bacterium]